MKRAAIEMIIYWLSAVVLAWMIGGYIVARIGWYGVPLMVPLLSLSHGLLPRLYITIKKGI